MQIKILVSLLMLLVTFCNAEPKKVVVSDTNALLIAVNDSTELLNVNFQDSGWACFGPTKFKDIGLRLSAAKICQEQVKNIPLFDSLGVLLKKDLIIKDSIIALKDSVILSDSLLFTYKDSIIATKDSIIQNREEVINLAEEAQMSIWEVIGYAAISMLLGFALGAPL